MSIKKTKIVHISTSIYGGAGIAAYRIHLALLAQGVNSLFLSLNNTELIKDCSIQSKNKSLIEKLINKIKWRLKFHFNIIVDRKERFIYSLDKISPLLNCEIATLPFSNYDVLKHSACQDADIIHLHWVAGILDYTTFFKNNTKPVVWTLHDLNAFQGIFHYKNDEIVNEDFTRKFDNHISNLKTKILKNRKCNLSIVSPSKWLLEKANNSIVFSNIKSLCIYNPIDNIFFENVGTLIDKKSLGISADSTIFLFVSQNVKNYRKGYDLMIGALKKVANKSITLLVIGEMKKIDIPEINIIFLGSVVDNNFLKHYYSIADAFILPSREDNLPNVMLESLACGTPVLSFNVGGMAEIIKDGFNGLKAKEINENDLAKTILNFIKNKHQYCSAEIKTEAYNLFNNLGIANEYIKIYKTVLDN